VLSGVSERGQGIVERGRERMLGGEAIVDGEQPRPRLAGQVAARAVVGVEVPGDEATAVEVDQERSRFGVGVIRCVQACAERAGRAAHRGVAGVDAVELGPGHPASVLPQLAPGLGRRHALEILTAADQVDEPQGELRLHVKLLAVDDDRPAGQDALGALGQSHDSARRR
jgi:hypothetical protein